MNASGFHWWQANISSGPVFCLLLGVSSDYAQPITGQVTEVTCPVISRAKPELNPSKRQKTGPGNVLMLSGNTASSEVWTNDDQVLCQHLVSRDHFAYTPNQWETTLQCNIVSYWLDAVFTKIIGHIGHFRWLGPNVLTRDFTNLNKIYRAYRTNVW